MATRRRWLFFLVALGVAALLLVFLSSSASGHFGPLALLPSVLFDLLGLVAVGLYVSDEKPPRYRSPLFGSLVSRAPPSFPIS